MLNYQEVYDRIKNEFCNTCDLRAIELQISGKNACFFFIDGYIDTLLFENNLLKPLKSVQNVEQVNVDVLNANTMFTTSIEEIPEVEKAI